MTRADWARSLTGMVILVGTLILSGNAILAHIAYGVFGFALALWLGWYLNSAIRRRMYARRSGLLMAAFRADDLISARKHLRSLEFVRRYPIGAAVLDMDEAVILCYEERFSEARGLLEGIDSHLLRVVVPQMMPYLTNNLAVCDVHLGYAGRAIESLAPMMQQLESVPEDLRANVIGTLGEAHLSAGDFATAACLFQQAITQGGTPRLQSIRCLDLGDAYSALGETEKAQAAYKRAIEECPASRYAERAREKLIQR